MINFYIGKKSPLRDENHKRDLDNEISILRQYDTRKTCLLDIGSNEGYFSVCLANEYTSVHAFEPIHSNFKLMFKNIKQFDNITPYKMAISNVSEEFEMLTDQGFGFNSGMCSRFETYVQRFMYNNNKPTSAKNQVEQMMRKYPTEIVKAQPIDSLNLEPSLIKIDVEGDEQRVLEGAKITINKFKPVIYLERNFGPDRIPLDDFMFWIGYKQVPENEFIYINNFYERRRETES